MRLPISTRLWAALFAIASLLPAGAREVQVRALAFKQGFPVELHAHHPTGSSTAGLVPLQSFLNHERTTLKFEGTKLAFTRRSAPASATSAIERLAEVEIPEDTESAILIFNPDSPVAGKDTCEVIVIDDSALQFPAGSYKVANLSKTSVKIEVGDHSHEFEPGEIKVIEKIAYGENQATGMSAYAKQDDAWKLVTTSVWANPGTRRVLQIFTSDSRSGRVALKGIRDVIVP